MTRSRSRFTVSMKILLADRKHQREGVEDRGADRRAAMPVGGGDLLDIETPVARFDVEAFRLCAGLRHWILPQQTDDLANEAKRPGLPVEANRATPSGPERPWRKEGGARGGRAPGQERRHRLGGMPMRLQTTEPLFAREARPGPRRRPGRVGLISGMSFHSCTSCCRIVGHHPRPEKSRGIFRQSPSHSSGRSRFEKVHWTFSFTCVNHLSPPGAGGRWEVRGRAMTGQTQRIPAWPAALRRRRTPSAT